MNDRIDLRSDTVTRPTDAMRAVMAAAPVGDDQYGEDPSTNRLQARCAELLGKEAAVWLPTGTMANQVALRTLTRPGDEVVASRESHAAWHELGGAAANAGVQIHEIGQGGRFSADELRAAVKPRNFAIFPTTTLVEVENTHNRAGGVVVPQDEVGAHLRDGARARPGDLSRRRSLVERERRQRHAGRRAGRAVRPRRRRLQQGPGRARRLAARRQQGAGRGGRSASAPNGRRDAPERHLLGRRVVRARPSPRAPGR